MEPWQFAAFAVFFACCLAQFWFLGQVRKALIDRHPDVFLEIERSSIFPQKGLQKFIRSSRHNDLADPKLSEAVIRCRWLFVTAICAWLVLAFGLVWAPPS
jgi:hypothetical protein